MEDSLANIFEKNIEILIRNKKIRAFVVIAVLAFLAYLIFFRDQKENKPDQINNINTNSFSFSSHNVSATESVELDETRVNEPDKNNLSTRTNNSKNSATKLGTLNTLEGNQKTMGDTTEITANTEIVKPMGTMEIRLDKIDKNKIILINNSDNTIPKAIGDYYVKYELPLGVKYKIKVGNHPEIEILFAHDGQKIIY